MSNESTNKTATNAAGKQGKVHQDNSSNTKELARIELANAMVDILNSTNEDGKRQLNLTVAFFNLPETFSFNAVKHVLSLTGEEKTAARHKLLNGMCNDYTALLDEQKAYAAVKGKKTDEMKSKYDDRKLKLDAMDKMVNLALTGIYYLRHKETGNIQSVSLQSAKNKRTDIVIVNKIGETIEADGSKTNNVEKIIINASELIRRGKKLMPTKSRNVDTGKSATSGAGESAAINLKLVSDFIGAQAAALPKDKGLVDLPDATKATVADILKTFLPLEFADRTAGVFNGNAFAAYVADTLKLKFEFDVIVEKKSNGKTKQAA